LSRAVADLIALGEVGVLQVPKGTVSQGGNGEHRDLNLGLKEGTPHLKYFVGVKEPWIVGVNPPAKQFCSKPVGLGNGKSKPCHLNRSGFRTGNYDRPGELPNQPREIVK